MRVQLIDEITKASAADVASTIIFNWSPEKIDMLITELAIHQVEMLKENSKQKTMDLS